MTQAMFDVGCGGAASAFAGVITNPLDVMRTRMQLQGDLCKQGTYEKHYSGVIRGLHRVAKEEGLLALQKGLVASVIWQFTQNGLRIGLYPVFKSGLDRSEGWVRTKLVGENASRKEELGPSLFVSLVAGALSGGMGCFVASPFILVKTRIQSQCGSEFAGRSSLRSTGVQHEYKGVMHGLRSMYNEGGVRRLWYGSRTAVKRTMVGSATQLVSYDFVSRFLVDHFKNRGAGNNQQSAPLTAKDPRIHFTAALLSSFVVVLVMNPFEVVMTRTYNNVAGKVEYSGSVRSAMVRVYHVEGVRGLYKGCVPMLARFGPHTVITFMVYERLRDLFGRKPSTVVE